MKKADLTLVAATTAIASLFEGGEYHSLYTEAAQLTSQADSDNNQAIKFVRQAGLYHALRGILRGGLSGDVAECGCFRGQSSYVIAKLLTGGEFPGRFFIFDSFEGLSDFEAEDMTARTRSAENAAQIRRRFAASEENFLELMAPFAFAEIMKGWIPERFHDVESRRFAFVHLDVDLYRPIRQSLEFFFPRLQAGGSIVVDDYNWRNFPGANKAVDEFVAKHPEAFFMPFQIGGCLIRKDRGT